MDEMECSECGADLKPSQEFCGDCGIEIEWPEEAEAKAVGKDFFESTEIIYDSGTTKKFGFSPTLQKNIISNSREIHSIGRSLLIETKSYSALYGLFTEKALRKKYRRS